MKMFKTFIFASLSSLLILLTGCLSEGSNSFRASGNGIVEESAGGMHVLLDYPVMKITGNFQGKTFKDGDRVFIYYTVDYDNQPSSSFNTPLVAEIHDIFKFNTTSYFYTNRPDTMRQDTMVLLYAPAITYYEMRPNLMTIQAKITTDAKDPQYRFQLAQIRPYSGGDVDTLVLSYTKGKVANGGNYDVLQSFRLPDYGSKEVKVAVKFRAKTVKGISNDSIVVFKYKKPTFE